MITVIEVPDYNDSFSRVVLSGKEYLIRFSYNFEEITGHSVSMTTIEPRMCRESKSFPTLHSISSISAMACQKVYSVLYRRNRQLAEKTFRKKTLNLSFSRKRMF